MAITLTEILARIDSTIFPNSSRFITASIMNDRLKDQANFVNTDVVRAIIIAETNGASEIFANNAEMQAYASATEGQKAYVVGDGALYQYTSGVWVEIATLAELEATRVVLKQGIATISTVNNLDLTDAQFYLFSDNNNTLQLISTTGIQGGTLIAIEHLEGHTVEHLATSSGVYKPISLSTKANHTFINDTVVLYIYDEINELWKEVGRVTLGESESEITLPTVKLIQFPAYNMTTGGTITGLTTTMQTAVTVTNKGTASVSLTSGYLTIGAGTIYGIEGKNSSGATVFKIPCAEANATFPVVVGYNSTETEYLLIDGVKTVVYQDDDLTINEQGWTLHINSTNNSFVYEIEGEI